MLPILYSFRRCPYAIRARLAVKYSGTRVEIREVLLAEKPQDMLDCSPKGTVPVLKLPDQPVIDESFDIMLWSLTLNDPDNWLGSDNEFLQETKRLIKINDGSFKEHLDHYKYAARFPEYSADHYRDEATDFIQKLENLLNKNQYLLCDHITIADIAIFPFIRQFAYVDKGWFDQTQYKKLQLWLNYLLDQPLFSEVMHKYPRWKMGDDTVIF